MEFPPSLPADILRRSFHVSNGELGLIQSDVQAFLAACEADGIEVLGWELWIVDHACRPDSDEPLEQNGAVWGCIPSPALIQGDLPTIFGGVGGRQEISRQIADLNLEQHIKPKWLDHIRYNITLAGQV